MMRPLIIVESSVKAETLTAQLGDTVETLILQSPPVRADFIPPKDGLRREAPRFDFSPLPEQQAFLDQLLAHQGAEIYLAFDGDRRGEFWSWLINGYWTRLALGGVQAKRLALPGLNADLLRRSLRLPGPVDEARGAAICTKILFDTALGRHLTRLLGSSYGPASLPLNALSLTTLFLLAEREAEIRLYTPLPRWKIDARLAMGQGEITVKLEEAYGITDDGFLRNEKELHAATHLMSKQGFVIAELERSPLRIPPPQPCSLADLLQDAMVFGGLTAMAAMTAIRRLYHGVALDRQQGLISAFLPQSEDASGPLFAAIRAEVKKRIGPDALGPEAPLAGGGLILPLRPELGPAELTGKLGADECLVYALLWARAMASQMKEASGERILLTVMAGEHCRFKGFLQEFSDLGFFAAYRGCRDKELPDSTHFGELQAGTQLLCRQIVPEKNAGLPPEYHGLGSLAAELADFSLDFDGATVAMLQQMSDSGYLKFMPDGTIRCAGNTDKLIAVFNRAFPTMKGVHLSAYLSQTIEEAVSGRKSLAFALQQFEQTMIMRGEILVKVAVPLALRKRGLSSRNVIRLPEDGPSVETPPPLAGRPAGEQVLPPSSILPGAQADVAPVSQLESLPEEAQDGAAEESILPPTAMASKTKDEQLDAQDQLAVSPEQETAAVAPAEPVTEELGLPVSVDEQEATLTPELAAAVERIFADLPGAKQGESEEEVKIARQEPALVSGENAGARPCPDCGRPLLLKEDRFGRYWQCSGHPQCRHAESGEKPGEQQPLCPLCQRGQVLIKRTPTNKIFYVCPEADCEFMAWAKPHPRPCPLCGSPFLVEKAGLGGTIALHCPKAGCSYSEGTSEGGGLPEVAGQELPKKKILVRRVVRGAGSSGTVKKVRVVRKK